MNTIQSYWYIFSFLEEYFNRTKLDDLGGFLGSMLVDEALYADWEDITKGRSTTATECLHCLVEFLRTEAAEFGIDLSSLINSLVDLDSHPDVRDMWNRTPETLEKVFARLRKHIGRDWKDLQ